MILVFIILFVGYMMFSILFNKSIFKGLLHGQVIECVWTTVPGLILVQIALPSLSLLYLMEDSPSPNLTLKAVGHQWYWEYEYTDFWSEGGGSLLPLNPSPLSSSPPPKYIFGHKQLKIPYTFSYYKGTYKLH